MKWAMAAATLLAGLLAVWLLVFNMPEKEPPADDAAMEWPNTDVDEEKAVSVYKSNCMGCHGDEYQGAMGPALMNVGEHMSREQIYSKVMKGGGGMPGFEGRLQEEELINLSNWLAELQ